MLTCLLWPEQTHWNTYGCQSGRHFCRAVTKWTDSTICKSCSIRSWTEILPNRTWSTRHHMGVWTLSHIYLWSSIHCLYRSQTPNIHFNNTRSQLSARIERWVLRTQPYDMTVIYRPGHNNPADYLSRHPTHLPPSDREQKIAEEYINYILSTSTSKAMTIDEVAMETAKDKTLTTVIQAILTNKWHGVEDGINKATFHTLHANRAELSLAHKDSIILKGHQIVLPEALQNKAAKIALAGHQGIVKTMALLREKVWFKNMQPQVEENIKNCHTCQVSTHKPAREPLQMSLPPAAPWACQCWLWTPPK